MYVSGSSLQPKPQGETMANVVYLIQSAKFLWRFLVSLAGL